ncbi:acyl carrier protein [Paenibacillus jamilae]|uniref:phosphopantetheine-binding protein n=1 Tax=Paenibacillus TaxID=44249 RepID=UPI00142DE90F|nr:MULTISPECIES: phosphopantetheine-binding protein [Paenibacillus]MDP9678214.1 acyl carrier protein [Paenibacillus jamilae]KAF6614399.1 acyl carrier protein [Paenibacillus sp. EKM101P]KAF6616640.1 acyl carrier protein [Paenibacillus sp. EKM102P]KAF6625501.1 acyl carrier protein [Paenibacillus sp. EKM10P]KAF6641739.1 acyl carrier protein [Paenibacillus sp. EKM11P]
MENNVVEKLLKIVEGLFNTTDIDMERDFNEFGLNSLDYIKLIVAIEDEFEIEFDDDALTMREINKFKDFVNLIVDMVQA